MDFPFHAIQSMLGQKPPATTATATTTSNAPSVSVEVSSSHQNQQGPSIIIPATGGPPMTPSAAGGYFEPFQQQQQEILRQQQQPAKITMNIPSFLMPKITPSSSSPNYRGSSPIPSPVPNVQNPNPTATTTSRINTTENITTSGSSGSSNPGQQSSPSQNMTTGNSPVKLINPYTGLLSPNSSPIKSTGAPSMPSITSASTVTTMSTSPFRSTTPAAQQNLQNINSYQYNPPQRPQQHPSLSSMSTVVITKQDTTTMPLLPTVSKISKTIISPTPEAIAVHQQPVIGTEKIHNVPTVAPVEPGHSMFLQEAKVIPVQLPQKFNTPYHAVVGMKICSVPGCNTADTNLQLFTLPKDTTARTWCQILGITQENNKPLLDNILICQLHFDASQFESGSEKDTLKLKPNAMPSGKVTVVRTTPSIVSPTPPPQQSSMPLTPLQLTSAMYPNLTMTPTTNSPQTTRNDVTKEKKDEQSQQLPQQIPSVSRPPPLPSMKDIISKIGQLGQQQQKVPMQVAAKTETVMVKGSTQIQLIKPDSASVQKNIKAEPSRNQQGQQQNVQQNKQQQQLSPTRNSSSNKRPGPKCHQLSADEPTPKVHLGAYARPTNISQAATAKLNNITIEDMSHLVMPSENWSINVYTSPISGKPVYVISETLLNSDLVEIVRKSITIQPRWSMKFSVMAQDVSHFNLGLGVSDISDIQAVLDVFDSFKVCRGYFDNSLNKATPAVQMKGQLYVDKKLRSMQCTLMLPDTFNNSNEKPCLKCLKLLSK